MCMCMCIYCVCVRVRVRVRECVYRYTLGFDTCPSHICFYVYIHVFHSFDLYTFSIVLIYIQKKKSGKDMYYDGWADTVQINYGHPKTREEMCKVL